LPRMNREEDEKLWDLLGHGAAPQASPFFARNVLRKIRLAQGEAPARRWFNLRWLVPAAGVAVTIIAALLLRVQIPSHNLPGPRSENIVLSESEDGDLMADLEDLVGDDNSPLDDVVQL
jgi:hypothetical protein